MGSFWVQDPAHWPIGVGVTGLLETAISNPRGTHPSLNNKNKEINDSEAIYRCCIVWKV